MVVRRDFVAWLGSLTLVAILTFPSISQEPTAAWKRPEGTPPAWLTADAARWARRNETRKAMTKKVTYNFQGIPLNNAMQEISRQVGVPIYINEVELDHCGCSSDLPVTAQGKELRLSELKEQILGPLDLNWRIRETEIEITSDDDVSAEPFVLVYDLAYKSHEATDPQSLIDVLAQTIDSDEWRDYGGTGDSAMLTFGSALIVSAPDDTHRKIAEFISGLNKFPVSDNLAKVHPRLPDPTGQPPAEVANMIRVVRPGEPLSAARITLPAGRDFTLVKMVESKPEAAKVAASAPKQWTPPSSPAPAWLSADLTADREAILAKLREPISVDIKNLPLNQAMAELLKGAGIAFWIDSVELDNVGTSFDVPVSVSLKQTSLSEVLERVFKPLDLTYRIDGQRLEITSTDAASSELSPRVYDMAHLSEKPFDMALLTQVITATVDPDEWRDFGGIGDATIIPSGSQLFISASDSTYIKIESLLYQLTMLHPDNFPRSKVSNFVEVSVQRIPGGSTIEIPAEGFYRLQE